MSNDPARISPMARVADPPALLRGKGITPPMLARIGAIAVFAGNIEYETEMVVWVLEGHEPAGKRHPMDGRPISDWIKELARIGATMPESGVRKLFEAWCQAAEPAFRCRNSIFHGVTVSFGPDSEWASFLKNPSWQGEIRKRSASQFHASEHTLMLIEQVFAVLYRVIATIDWIARDKKIQLSEANVKKLLSALREARSASWELENLTAAMNHEKY